MSSTGVQAKTPPAPCLPLSWSPGVSPSLSSSPQPSPGSVLAQLLTVMERVYIWNLLFNLHSDPGLLLLSCLDEEMEMQSLAQGHAGHEWLGLEPGLSGHPPACASLPVLTQVTALAARPRPRP